MRACARRRGISLVGSSSLKAFRPTAVEGIVVRPGGAYHVRFCFGARDAAGLLARGATLRSEREGRGRANGAITGRRGTSATARLGMKRGCDRENTHAQTVIEGNQESRADVQVGRSRSRFLIAFSRVLVQTSGVGKNAETKKTLGYPSPTFCLLYTSPSPRD